MNNKRIEFDTMQMKKMNALLEGPEPDTRLEKDIWNLRYLEYSIKYGSYNYNRGMISTLRRTIEKLKGEY